MQPNKQDMARLWDMLDAARAVIQFTRDKRFEDFIADRMVRTAVERNLEIIGEAARGVSQAFRESHPEIPWKAIIALRNVLLMSMAKYGMNAFGSCARNNLLF